ncbi:hypothetical protein E2C01_059647 [Portunus trituberculatus]|uniref:Uncharacterized protein n=1 Tax=Portunus trituberculatus TaxID=210409 RepID=A0A5B7H356_PORTR|nr:hypothetical protein [Portunus trituberculatus]
MTCRCWTRLAPPPPPSARVTPPRSSVSRAGTVASMACVTTCTTPHGAPPGPSSPGVCMCVCVCVGGARGE